MEEVVLRIDADTGQHRAVIARASTGAYRIEVERLIDSFDAGGAFHGQFWSAISGLSSYTDDLDRAQALAEELLRVGQSASS